MDQKAFHFFSLQKYILFDFISQIITLEDVDMEKLYVWCSSIRSSRVKHDSTRNQEDFLQIMKPSAPLGPQRR
jgi:hypothetical protein